MKPVLPLLAALALSGSVRALDGGEYPPRPPPPPPPWGGPGDGPGAPRGPGGPTSPAGPALPGPGPGAPAVPGAPFSPRPPLPPLLEPGPVTRAADEPAEAARWREWWSFNHDALVDVRARLEQASARSGENRVVAERRALAAKLTPVLVALVEGGERDAVLRQALIALGRLARTELTVPLQPIARWHLGLPSPALHEAALIALALEGEPDSRDFLRSVVLDAEEARALVHGDGSLPPRLRAVAAYALGILGTRDAEESTRRPIVHALLHALSRPDAPDEVQIACALALGRVPIRPCAPAEMLDPVRQFEEFHLCGAVVTEYLEMLARAAEQPGELRGHAAAALGQLAAAAGAATVAGVEDHPVAPAREALVAALVEILGGAKELPEVRQGALAGLAAVADAGNDRADRAARERIFDATKDREPLTRALALVTLGAALGRIDGTEGTADGWKDGVGLLLRELSRARGERAGWSALALGVAGNGRARTGVPSEGVSDALARDLAREKDGEAVAARALALALVHAGDTAAHAALRAAFAARTEAGPRASLALALGLLAVPDASEALAAAAADAPPPARPALAVGLRLLGDSGAVDALTARLGASPPLAEALATVRALAFLQDPAAGEALLALLAKKGVDERLRAALVWCLGALADPTWPDWTAAYANGLAYGFAPETLLDASGDGRGVLDWR